MNTQEEIIQLRDELKKLQVKAQKSRVRGTIGLVLLVLVTVCSFVYAFVQQVAAEKSAMEAVVQRELVEASQKEAIRNLMEAKRQETVAREQKAMATVVYDELRKCCEKKK